MVKNNIIIYDNIPNLLEELISTYAVAR